MKDGAIVKQEKVDAVIQFSEDEKKVLKETIGKGLEDAQFGLFVEVCKQKGLNPFANQIYAVQRYDKKLNKQVMTIQTGIDGYRAIAERTRQYKGQTPPAWCGADGEWAEVWLQKNPPTAAKVGIYRKGFEHPVYGIAKWDEFYPGETLGFMWRKFPSIMLLKCAEAQALRKAFPNDLSGLYVDEEMAQVDNEDPIDPEQSKEQKQEKIKQIANKEEVEEVDFKVVKEEKPKKTTKKTTAKKPPKPKEEKKGTKSPEQPKPVKKKQSFDEMLAGKDEEEEKDIREIIDLAVMTVTSEAKRLDDGDTDTVIDGIEYCDNDSGEVLTETGLTDLRNKLMEFFAKDKRAAKKVLETFFGKTLTANLTAGEAIAITQYLENFEGDTESFKEAILEDTI